MTKRERVTAAFQGKPVDHVPVCMWQHVPKKYWNDDREFAAFQLRAWQHTDVDFMKLSGDKYFPWPSDELENIQNAGDLYRLQPLGPGHRYIREQVDRAKVVVGALGPDCVTLQLVFAPLSYLRLRVGYPAMMRLIREDPEAMKHACDVIAEDVKELVKGFICEAGVDGIFYSVQNGETDRFTAEEYADWVKPSDKKVLDYANALSAMNAIHFCAWEGVPNRLSVWEDYKAPVISWSRYMDIMDIGEAKKHFGSTVWGGFDNRPGTLLYTGTRQEIEQEVRSLISQGGKTGYILGADCSLHNELDPERIRWAADEAHRI
jgi:Uroporphyrinogen-III decarboxylase